MSGKRYTRICGIPVGENICVKSERLSVDSKAFKIGIQSFVVAECSCGRFVLVAKAKLLSRHTKSCGCLHVESTGNRFRKHGARHTRAYNTWSHMKRRCMDTTHPRFAEWGGRGIAVCDEWLSFKTFLEDMGQPPYGRFSIDRIDNSKGYYPENCRWATDREQCNNKRGNVRLTFYGQTKTISEWSRISQVPMKVISKRLKSGWPEKLAVWAPSGISRKQLSWVRCS